MQSLSRSFLCHVEPVTDPLPLNGGVGAADGEHVVSVVDQEAFHDKERQQAVCEDEDFFLLDSPCHVKIGEAFGRGCYSTALDGEVAAGETNGPSPRSGARDETATLGSSPRGIRPCQFGRAGQEAQLMGG